METVNGVAVSSTRALLTAGDPHLNEEHPWNAWLNDAYTKVVKRSSESKIRKTYTEFGGTIAHNPNTGFTVCALPPMPDTPENRKRIPGQVSGVERPKPEPVSECPRGRWIVLNGDLGMSTGKASAQAAHVRTLMALQGLEQDEETPAALWATDALFQTLLSGSRAVIVSRDNGRTEIPKGSTTGLLVEDV